MHRCSAASLVGRCWDQSTSGAKGNGFGGIPRNQCLQYHLSEVDHLKKGRWYIRTYICVYACYIRLIVLWMRIQPIAANRWEGGLHICLSNPVHILTYVQHYVYAVHTTQWEQAVRHQYHDGANTNAPEYLKLTDCPTPLPMWGHFSSTAYTRPLYRNTASSWPLIETFFPRFGFTWPSVLAVPLWKSASQNQCTRLLATVNIRT